jgi:hypothetical protein
VEVALATAFALFGKETGIIAVPAALLVRSLVLARPLGDSLRMLGASLAGFSLWLAARNAAVGGASGSDTGSLLSEGLPWVPSIIALALKTILLPLRTGVLVVRDAVLLTDPALQLVHIALTTLLLLGLAAAVTRGARRTSTALLLQWLASIAPPVARASEAEYVICGSEAIQTAIEARLRGLGVPPNHLHYNY